MGKAPKDIATNGLKATALGLPNVILRLSVHTSIPGSSKAAPSALIAPLQAQEEDNKSKKEKGKASLKAGNPPPAQAVVAAKEAKAQVAEANGHKARKPRAKLKVKVRLPEKAPLLTARVGQANL